MTNLAELETAEENFDEELDAETLAEIEALASSANEESAAESGDMSVADEEDTAEDFDVDTEVVYAEQESDTAAGTESEEVDVEEAKRSMKARKPRAAANRKSVEDVLGKDAETVVTAVEGINAVKVKDKANNVLDFVTGARSKLSNFTGIALEAIQANDMKSADFVQLFRDSGYSEGTARSQGQQMTALLPALGITQTLKDGTHKLTKTNPVFVAIQKRFEEIANAENAAEETEAKAA